MSEKRTCFGVLMDNKQLKTIIHCTSTHLGRLRLGKPHICRLGKGQLCRLGKVHICRTLAGPPVFMVFERAQDKSGAEHIISWSPRDLNPRRHSLERELHLHGVIYGTLSGYGVRLLAPPSVLRLAFRRATEYRL